MGRIARAALVYFAAVFAIGAVLGVVRETAVRPWLGDGAAVAAEAPAMLLACWWMARVVMRRFAVAPGGARLGVAALALGLLMAAELGGSTMLRGMSVSQWLAHFATPGGAVALLLFLAFAVMPLVVGRKRVLF